MRIFKLLVVICLIANVFAVNHAQLVEILKAKNRIPFDVCLIQEKVSEEEGTKLLNNVSTNPSPAVKCFGSCLFEKIGTWKDGVILEDLVLEKLGPIFGEERVKNAIKTCRHIKGSDRCETMFKLIKCYIEA